jgi:hypothetical protein
LLNRALCSLEEFAAALRSHEIVFHVRCVYPRAKRDQPRLSCQVCASKPIRYQRDLAGIPDERDDHLTAA